MRIEILKRFLRESIDEMQEAADDSRQQVRGVDTFRRGTPAFSRLQWAAHDAGQAAAWRAVLAYLEAE